MTHGNGARTVRARGAVTACSSSARRLGDALDGGAVGAGRRKGVVGEHRWGLGVAPGRWSGGGAHPSGGSMYGGGAGSRHRGGGQRQGRRGSGERRAVDRRLGKELQVRCRSGEGKSWRGGERTRPAAVGCPF
jgi:hypothetical protein